MTAEEDRMIARIEEQAYVKGLADGKAEIRAAVEEATKYFRENDAAYLRVAVLSAYEDAARIADGWGEIGSHSMAKICGQNVAASIRVRAAEVGKDDGELPAKYANTDRID